VIFIIIKRLLEVGIKFKICRKNTYLCWRYIYHIAISKVKQLNVRN